MKSNELQILGLLERRLDEICIKMLRDLPSIEPMFPGMPRQTIPTSSLSGKDRSIVKKEWDKYLKRMSIKRRVVKLSDLERHCLCESEKCPDRLKAPGFMIIRDPFSHRFAALEIPNEVAIKILALDYVPEI